ncbi:MAG TPA: SDR family NAD(P)-dependent oxidoreductase [Pyrinomonadaceae bacterium]|jgi:NAD(P)-dependent dehydrogenase (short-subunit alcohol dehydrogenase family)
MKDSNKEALILAAAGAGALLAGRAVARRLFGYSLRGKVVLITGGSRGLGLVMAREFASEGAKIVICARRLDELEAARADLKWRGAEVLAVPCDVTDRPQVNEMMNIVRDRFGRIDVLVNNAGVIQVGPIEVMTIEDYEEAMKTHFWGPLYASLAVLPEMRRRREGRIVNISSIGGKISIPHLVPYSASKFALTGLSEGMRAELLKDGVVVTTVCPGLMRTGSPRNALFKGKHRAEYAWFAISDSLPVTSMNAVRAARQIVAATKRGDAEVTLTIQAQLAARFHGLFPGTTADLLAIVNRLLPGAGGIGRASARGKDSQSSLAPSVLTALSEKAATKNNEML